MAERTKGLIFAVPSKDQDFMKAQEEPSKGDDFLTVLKGEPEPIVRVVEKESRLTVYLSPAVHQKLRVRAITRETTITEYVRALLERDLAE